MLCADRWVSELPSEECVSETQSLSRSNTQVLEQLPSDAVLSAYRVHTPCCIKHSSAQTRSMNCVASPTCLAGIKILLSEKITFDDIVASTLGKGPSVMPASQQQREKHDACSATEGSTSSGVTPADLWGSPLRRGIRSFGNTCYLNAVMQMLFHISSVRDMVLKACVPPPEAGGRAKEVSAISSSGLGELFAEMAYSRTGEGADAQRFASFLSINSGMQQDAQEFFALLVDWLQREVCEDVRKVFEGTLLYHRRCSNCGRSVKREEPFSFLSLPVGCSLENVLETFLRAHEVDEFRCDGCGITSKASSHQYLRTLPDVLIVHFNRFTFNHYTHQREKITRSVGFPVEWDLTSYMERHQQNKGETVEGGSTPDCSSTPSTSPSENLYRLMGLVNHHGDSATCGHYTYHGRMDSHLVGGWCSFDNEEVKILRRFNCSRSASKEVYMLVYERCTKRASSRLSSNVPNSTLEPQNLQIHLPPHLEKHVRRLNHEVETARQAWELRRSAMLCFLREWEIVADAVFCSCAPRRGRARGSVNKSYDLEDYVAFPTRWLELLGSCFMLLSTGAKQCSNVTERKERLSRSYSGRRTTVPNKLPESCDGEHEDGVLLSSAGVLSCMTAEEKASMEGDHFLINSILRKASADFTGCMRCPHGKLAPWGEYKLLPVSATQRINSFLSSIPTLFAPLTTAGVFAPFTGWNLLSHACSSCVTVMSLKVSLLAKLYNRDKWAHDIISSAVSGGATHPAGTEGEKEEQVYISDIAVEHFENITKSYSESQDIINQQGFTGFLAFIKWGEKDGRAGADALPSSPEILCEHGFLTSGAAVRVVPISVWRFLRERFLHSFIVKWDGSELEPPASVAAQVGKLLPYISAKRMEICSECTGVHISTASAQHNERMEKINEAKQLPTVVAAGRTLSRPLADVQASHPNSSACRRNTKRSYNDHCRAWSKKPVEKIARIEAHIGELELMKTEKSEKRASHVARRCGRRKRQKSQYAEHVEAHEVVEERLPASVEAHSSSLQAAFEELAATSSAQCPDVEVVYGCVPTWWVARWYRWYAADPQVCATPPPTLNHSALRCQHGGTILPMMLLNPNDAFWSKKIVAKHLATVWKRVLANPSAFDGCDDDGDAGYIPPVLLVPLKEFMTLLEKYGGNGSVSHIVESTDLVNQLLEKNFVLLVERNGERKYEPPECDVCTSAILSGTAELTRGFTSGSLRLRFQLRRSKRSIYNATDVVSGISHSTTVVELKREISRLALEAHGFMLPLDVMELFVGRKPLKRVGARDAQSMAGPTEMQVEGPNGNGTRVGDGVEPPQLPTAAMDEEMCTLGDCGLCDGDEITVDATKCVLEKIEEIRTHSVQSSVSEDTEAFRTTRLCGVPDESSVGSSSRSVKVTWACRACTFLNEGAMRCRICGTPR